jgi:hypothetical protein
VHGTASSIVRIAGKRTFVSRMPAGISVNARDQKERDRSPLGGFFRIDALYYGVAGQCDAFRPRMTG